jgi:hypothetical protein
MTSDEIREFEHSTGLQVTNEEDWSDSDYDRVIAFLRAKAAQRTIPRTRPRCRCPGRSPRLRRLHSAEKHRVMAR